MEYPFCGYVATQIIDTYMSEGGDTVYRRHRCESRDRRLTTCEYIELLLPAVVKENGSRADHDCSKIEDSTRLALRKHSVSAGAIDKAIARTEEKLLSHGEKEVGSNRMGELVMRELKRPDRIRYIRFASMCRSFEDLTEFRDVLDKVAATNIRK